MVRAVYYLDTSALVKRYFHETGTPEVATLFTTGNLFLTASLTYAEMYSAMYRRHRDGVLSGTDLRGRLKEFEADWNEHFDIQDFAAPVRALLPALIRQVPLRGADAVHLATAMSFKSHGLDPVFVTCDRRLCTAAKDRGFRVKDPAFSE